VQLGVRWPVLHLEHEDAAADWGGEILFQLRAVSGDERLGVLDDNQAARAEKGQRLQFAVDVAPDRLVAGVRRQTERIVSLAQDAHAQRSENLALEEVLIAVDDVDGPRLAAGL